jgi:hypothetical protein
VKYGLCARYPVQVRGAPSGGVRKARNGSGTRERGKRIPETPGGTRAASPATRSRPGPTTVKGIKAKMPRWRAARRGCTDVHHGPAAAGHRLVASRAQRLVGAPTPSKGEAKGQECGRPLAQSVQTGDDLACPPATSLASRDPSKPPLRTGLNHGSYRPRHPFPSHPDERPLQ